MEFFYYFKICVLLNRTNIFQILQGVNVACRDVNRYDMPDIYQSIISDIDISIRIFLKAKYRDNIEKYQFKNIFNLAIQLNCLY